MKNRFLWLGLILISLGILNSCKKNPNGGGGCTPGPGGTHAFLTYSSIINPSTLGTEVFREELDKSVNIQVSHLTRGGRGFNGYAVVPSLSPNSLIFISDSMGTTVNSLFSIHADGTQLSRISTKNTIGFISMSLSPIPTYTSQNIPIYNFAVVYDPCPICETLVAVPPALGIFNSSTQSVQRLTSSYSHAEWSKDGTKIYFDSKTLDPNSPGIPHIYSILPDGTGLVQLTKTPYGEEYPSISPDGKTIAISSYMDSGHIEQEICFMNTDGTGLRKITNIGVTAVATQPCFSPLGNQIFFSFSDRSKPNIPSHIYSADIDGSNVQQFTTGNGEQFPFIGFFN